MSFHADQPIDGEQSPDLLEREGFCANLASAISLRAGSPGLVISLEGPWGSGKTSAINLIERALRKAPPEERPIVVRFNPWMIGSLDSLAAAFFVQLAASLGQSSHAERASRIADALLSYSRLVSLAKWIPGAEPYAEVVSKVLKSAGDATRSTGELTAVSIADQKQRVSDAIIELGRPFVVFVDDLDRLPPDEVFAMIRLVKAVSDFPLLTYVLAFDPEYVERALERAGIEQGRRYLDKLVQVRASLPRIGAAQLAPLIDRELDKLGLEKAIAVFPGEQDRLAQLYHRSVKFLLRTPRDVYRLCNRLRLSHPQTREEIGVADLLGLEAIAIAAPALHDHIRACPQAYVGPLDEDSAVLVKAEEVVEQHEVERTAAIGAAPAAIHRPLHDLLGELFPLTAKRQWTSSERRPARTTGRIACPANLVIVLFGGLRAAEVSLSQVRRFLEDPSSRAGIISEVATPNLLGDFLDLVNSALRAASIIDAENFIESLARVAELDVVPQIDRGTEGRLLAVPISTQIFWVLRQVLESMEGADRLLVLRRLASSATYLAISSDVIRFLCNQHGRLGESPREREEAWLVSGSELDQIVANWAESTRGAFLEGRAFDSNEVGPAFYLLLALDPNAAREVTARHLEADPSLDELARAIGSGSWTSSGGHFAEMREDLLSKLADVPTFRRRAAERLKDASLPPELRAIYTSIVTGQRVFFSKFG